MTDIDAARDLNRNRSRGREDAAVEIWSLVIGWFLVGTGYVAGWGVGWQWCFDAYEEEGKEG